MKYPAQYIHGKVHIFWEGHKILRNLHLSNVVPVKSTVDISQNVVAFSEYMNFNVKQAYLKKAVFLTYFPNLN